MGATHFLELYTIQRFSIYPDIRTKHLSGEGENKKKHTKTQLLSLHPSGVLRMDGGGGETNSGMFVKPNILNSIMISVPNIWGVEIYFWIAYKAQHFQFYPDICVKYLGVETYFWKMCTTQDFSFYPDIFAKICVCAWGGGYTKHS